MRLSKKILKHPVTQYALSWLLAFFIWFAYATSRKIRYIHPDAEPYLRGEKNGVFAFWHGRMMLLPAFCPPKRKMRVLISLHRDGMLISQVIGHFGQATINGSSSKGGKEAVNEIIRCLDAGDNISITPDGPRGPAQVAAKGVVAVARYAQKPVLPVTFSSTRARKFNSWDRFTLALPFGRIHFYVGAPIFASSGDSTADDMLRLEVETAMNALVIKADEALNA